MRRSPKLEMVTSGGGREVVVEERDLLLAEGGPSSSGAGGAGGARPAAAASARSVRPVSVLTLTLVASIGGLLFGIDTSVISGALPYLRDELLAGYVDDPAR